MTSGQIKGKEIAKAVSVCKDLSTARYGGVEVLFGGRYWGKLFHTLRIRIIQPFNNNSWLCQRTPKINHNKYMSCNNYRTNLPDITTVKTKVNNSIIFFSNRVWVLCDTSQPFKDWSVGGLIFCWTSPAKLIIGFRVPSGPMTIIFFPRILCILKWDLFFYERRGSFLSWHSHTSWPTPPHTHKTHFKILTNNATCGCHWLTAELLLALKKKFHFSIPSRPALRSTQPPI
jgi:hypothetical protein